MSRVHISTRTDGEVAVVEPVGDLDAVTSLTLAKALEELLDTLEDHRGVVIDFAGVSFCDSRCIGVLVAAYRRARDLGLGFAVAAPMHNIHRLFRIAGIDQILTIEDDMSGALAAVRGG